MSVLNENQKMGASGAGGEFEIEQSLKINESGSFLSWTPYTAGNRRTWTWSGWVKRAGLTDGTKTLFAGFNAGNDNGYIDISFVGTDKIGMGIWNTTYRVSSQVFRDPSAWYHIVVAIDTTQSTASNRLRFYSNGEEITSWSTNNAPSQNFETAINDNKAHWLGSLSATQAHTDGYLAEVNFIDGQALTPDKFGETGDYGEWKPSKYAGTYGTNGFYLPFKQDYSVEGFSTVVYGGNGASSHYIGGVGFKPDFLWIKRRDAAGSHCLFDAIRGDSKGLHSDNTSAEWTDTGVQKEFNTDGFTTGNHQYSNHASGSYVAWNWDMGGTTASNTAGTINSSVRANQAYGQSIVSYTGNATAGATIGHGLASVPNMVIVKNRTLAGEPWRVYHSSNTAAPETEFLNLSDTSATTDASTIWNDTAPTATVVSLGSDVSVNQATAMIAYCFSDVTNYSKFSSYSGNGSTTGPVVTTGFSPAFVMIKRTDAGDQWIMLDNTRSPSGLAQKWLAAESSNAEASGTSNNVQFSSTGFQPVGVDGMVNASGGTYIYAAFADTREYAYWLDQSGNNNDWTSEGGLTESDVMLDSPTNNFCTLNPLSSFTGYATAVLSQGNLQASLPDNAEGKGSISVGSGKWYFEGFAKTATNNKLAFGIHKADGIFTGGTSIPNNSSAGLVWFGHSGIQGYASDSSYGTFTTGDIIGVKLDMDSKTIQFTKNGTAQGTKDFSSANFDTVVASVFSGQTSNVGVLNFGQDSSFAGNKTPQGNQDANGIGDFYYAPPTGFLALCTKSLPSVDVIPSENFNTVLYTGNGSTNAISVGFKPDLVWGKDRVGTDNHHLFDILRGTNQRLISNQNAAENTESNCLNSFDTNGFTLGSNAGLNANGEAHVAWNWKAGGSASSNSNGTITSQVSANVDAGFSIVSYTGNGANDGTGINSTVGHGLANKPELIIRKDRDTAVSWVVQSTLLGSGNMNQALFLNTTSAVDGGQGYMNNTAPTSTVFTLGNQVFVNVSGRDYISYCFHSVESYSKVGSYIGNGNVNGPFVNCGLINPAWVMIKRTDSASHWEIHDIAREPNNVKTKLLNADQSNAEDNNANSSVDFLSNGFKLRTSHAERNASGGTYIFLAFAESPFKNSNAR